MAPNGHHHLLLPRSSLSFAATTTAITFLLLSPVSPVILNPSHPISGGGAREEIKGDSGEKVETMKAGILSRRRLVGPGSSPPTCRSKCGRCTPCKAVHVPIQPGLTMPLEYYPEAWRCKCGNKLYMP